MLQECTIVVTIIPSTKQHSRKINPYIGWCSNGHHRVLAHRPGKSIQNE